MATTRGRVRAAGLAVAVLLLAAGVYADQTDATRHCLGFAPVESTSAEDIYASICALTTSGPFTVDTARWWILGGVALAVVTFAATARRRIVRRSA
ncbi:MAG: hypothetical protein AB7V62_02655 [Thermoleophilia bacterium]